MQGHTDKSTINKRRPLTENMRRVLATLIEKGSLRHRDLTQTDANCCRALCDRGYAIWLQETLSYAPTDAGRAAGAAA